MTMTTVRPQFKDIGCSHCHARPGQACKTPTGRVASSEHLVRRKALSRAWDEIQQHNAAVDAAQRVVDVASV